MAKLTLGDSTAPRETLPLWSEEAPADSVLYMVEQPVRNTVADNQGPQL
jgi:hypothetical protein